MHHLLISDFAILSLLSASGLYNNNNSHSMTKPTKWIVHPVKTHISLCNSAVWSASSLPTWRSLGSLAILGVHSEDWSDSADAQISLGICQVWYESSLGAHVILLVLSCCGLYSFTFHHLHSRSLFPFPPFSICNYIWAPSSEFVSSSIPSWQILTAHAQPFRGARDLAFCLKVPLDSLPVWASSEGSGETARMRRLTWIFAARIGDKYQIRLTRSIWASSQENLSSGFATK